MLHDCNPEIEEICVYSSIMENVIFRKKLRINYIRRNCLLKEYKISDEKQSRCVWDDVAMSLCLNLIHSSNFFLKFERRPTNHQHYSDINFDFLLRCKIRLYIQYINITINF